MMLHTRRLFVLLAVLLGLLVTPAMAGSGDANLFLGRRDISDDDLEEADIDSQNQIGVAVSLDFDWPVAIAIDLLSSSDDNTLSDTASYGNYTYTLSLSADADVLELDIGVRKFFMETIRPYVGGGLAWTRLQGELRRVGQFSPGPTIPITLVDDSDSGFGYWLNAGFLYTVGKHFNIGVDLRYSDTDAELQPTPLNSMGTLPPKLKLDSGGFQYGIVVGGRW